MLINTSSASSSNLDSIFVTIADTSVNLKRYIMTTNKELHFK